MSKTAEKYKSYYDKGFWTIAMLKNMVEKEKITAEEYEEITGESYA